MHRSRPGDDPDRRWRRFSRSGWRLAGVFAALWFAAFALLFRLALPLPAGAKPSAPALAWWPAEGADAWDVRSVWTPAAFALATPAGFTHALRRERIGLTPPVESVRPWTAYLGNPRPLPRPGLTSVGVVRPLPAERPAGLPSVSAVFPPRPAAAESPHLEFPAGWESRLFSGIDLNFSAWTNAAWTARIELRFDARGVPISVLLAQPSGLPEIDRRLVRSAGGWRLLEPAAARAGLVAWLSPAAPAPELAAGGAAGEPPP